MNPDNTLFDDEGAKFLVLKSDPSLGARVGMHLAP
jgi:hypothetical protein